MVTLSSGLSLSAVPRIRARPGNELGTSLGWRQNPGSNDHTCTHTHTHTYTHTLSSGGCRAGTIYLVVQSGIELSLQWLPSLMESLSCGRQQVRGYS